jgi:hypothetical protein
MSNSVLNARLLACLVCVSLASVGCPGNDATPIGAAGSGGGVAGNTAASAGSAGSSTPAVSFSAIYAMIFPMSTNARCNACHGMPANDITNGNLHMGMDQATAYSALMGTTSTSSMCGAKAYVVPGQPDLSLLFQKLSPTPPCGSRMPLGGSAFSAAQLDMIRSWIAGGAKND